MILYRQPAGEFQCIGVRALTGLPVRTIRERRCLLSVAPPFRGRAWPPFSRSPLFGLTLSPWQAATQSALRVGWSPSFLPHRFWCAGPGQPRPPLLADAFLPLSLERTVANLRFAWRDHFLSLIPLGVFTLLRDPQPPAKSSERPCSIADVPISFRWLGDIFSGNTRVFLTLAPHPSL